MIMLLFTATELLCFRINDSSSYPYFKYDFLFKYDTTQSFTRTSVLKLSVTVCTLALHTAHVRLPTH
jgi:hypothetical protein